MTHCRVGERRQFLEESLHSMASSSRSQVFIIVPEIASLLFQDRQVIETLIGQPITDIDLLRGQFEPRTVLNALFQGQSATSILESRLPSIDLSPLRQIPVIQMLQTLLQDAATVALAT